MGSWFSRYFIESEVGAPVAIINCMVASFCIGIALVWLFKPWGLTSWHRNAARNRQNQRQIQFHQLQEELKSDQDENREQILDMGFEQLRDALSTESLSAVQVLRAYQWKALSIQEKYNCITELVKEALDIAKELDEKYKGQPKPALFGMPFSVKENFAMVGYDLTRGLAKNLYKPRQDECSLVSHLRELGAVPFVRTNLPQTMISWVCSNPVYGTTLNPHSVERTIGGSSGGEACLLASGGCTFGTGSDLAGSLRIPAHCCGVCTLKPTAARLKATGAHPAIAGQSKLGLAYGFFTEKVQTLNTLLQHTLVKDYFARVPQTAPLPFSKPETTSKSLKIGYFVDDGFLTAVPACQRAVQEAVSILSGLGHEMVKFEVPDPFKAASLIQKSLFCDNAQYLLDALKYEDVDPLLKPTFAILKVPLCIRSFLSLLIRPFWPQLSNQAGNYHKNVSALRESNEHVDAYVREFTRRWQEAGLDALVCPGFPVPAVPNRYPAKLTAVLVSSGLYNLLDFPAGVLPMTKVTKEDDQKLLSEYPNKEMAGKNLLLSNPTYYLMRQAAMDSEGLPVGVQVVTLPFREELCLEIMQVLEDNRK